MISRRIIVNLVAFFTLFAVMTTWAATSVVHFDAIERPYRIAAEFESSPGLQPNVQATYLGIPVGTIASVDLQDDRVLVEIDIDRGVEIPVGISAAVRRKSAVGEPYVALDPPAEDSGEMIEAGYLVPLERTTIPLSYGELFAAIDGLVTAIPADSLSTVLRETSVALAGRGPQIRQILANAESLSVNAASRSETFDELFADLTTITGVLADRREGIGSGFDNLAATTATLAGKADTIESLLTRAPDYGVRIRSLLDASYADMSCLFTDLGSVFDQVNTPEHQANLIALLRSAADARDALQDALVPTGDGGADGPYLGGSFGLEPNGPGDLDAYDPFPTLPEPPTPAGCDASGGPSSAAAGDADAVTAESSGSGPSGDGGVTAPERPSPERAAEPATSDRGAGNEEFPLETLVFGIAALLAAILTVATRPWRFLPFGTRNGRRR